MALISAIVATPRKPGRYDLLADGEHVATISLDVLERLQLSVGESYDDVAPTLAHESALLATYDRALNMLSARARARTELRRLLVRKGEPAELVDAALQRLADQGLLDDAQFARQFARSKALGSGISKRRLSQELGRKGVAREVGEEAIGNVYEEEGLDDGASIERVARKKYRTLLQLDAETQRRRLYGFLARRGFDAADVGRMVKELVGSDPHAGMGDDDIGDED
ncbi:MAG: Regulatory protein recX [Gemmatimonadetes bacterium]|nr:Regulatory protein recX [Gemmatimonadota bacterium]